MTAPAPEQLDTSKENGSELPASDPEILWLIRLASIGVILLGAAVVWKGLYPSWGHCIFKKYVDYHYFFSDDYFYDELLFPLVFFYFIEACRGLIVPCRANLRHLSIAYFTFFGRAALKLVMCRYFNNGKFDGHELPFIYSGNSYGDELPILLTIGLIFLFCYVGHEGTIHLLRHRAWLNGPQRKALKSSRRTSFQLFVTIYFSLLLLIILLNSLVPRFQGR